MSIWAYLSIGLCLAIILRSVKNFHNLRNSLTWLRARYNTKCTEEIRFFVCIPALNEQSTIIKTIETLLNQSCPSNLVSIYIATSAKEVSSSGLPTTKEVVDRYISDLDEAARDRVHVLHYPKKDGYMAHQINFVADSLRTELKKPGAYFVIYNADSRIDRDTLRIASSIISSKASSRGEQPTLLQQSAIYQYAGKSSLAEGAGLHQTLWTLTHEIPRLLRQSSRIQNLKGLSYIESIKSSRIAHCVGHGLFVRGDYYLTHPLPQDILNEDLPYGLLACALREPIYPVPSLELASTPNKITNVYLQKATWFNPFFEFIDYGKSLIRQKSYISKFEVWWLLIQAYSSLVIWLVHSTVLVGALIVSIMAGWAYAMLWVISFSLYWFIPAIIVTRQRTSLRNGGSNSHIAIVGGIPYILTHSFGPIISVCRWSIAKICGTKPAKRKTESA